MLGHKPRRGWVRQPGAGAAGSTSSRAGVQIEQVFGPEAIQSPILPAAVGSLLVEMEHMLYTSSPVILLPQFNLPVLVSIGPQIGVLYLLLSH